MTNLIAANQVTLLRNGAQYFPALEAAIDGAQHEIHLQAYIYERDEIGQRIGEALKRAAARGVKVYVLLDGFGSKDLPKAYVSELIASGIEVQFFRPKISPWTLKRSRLRRMHRKLVTIDDSCAFIGGINIIDDYNTPGHVPPRVDYAVRVQGPLLAVIQHSAGTLWRRVCWAYLQETHFVEHRHKKPLPAGSMWAAFVVRDNLWHRYDIEQAYLLAMERATSEIVIACAYFLPGLRFRWALHKAAKRGVRVILLLQARVEYRLLDFASHALYSSLLRRGIEIYEYHRSFMHSKVAVIDRRWATVGSSNIDPMSFLLAREANILVEDAGFAAELREDLQQAMDSGAYQVTRDGWQHGHLFKRFFSWLVYGLVRLMMGIAGYSDRR